MVSSRGHKKRAVTKRAEYFNQIATDFPLHRQVPLVPQYNDPVNTAPQYVYTDFWIPPTFNGISTDKGTFASLGRRSVEVRDGRGRETVFSVYTELQDKPSVLERRLNQAVQRCIENGRAPRGNVLVIKHWAGSRDFTDIECWDRGIVNDIFQSRLPTAIGHRILQESGLREWTMVKRVSRFHSAEVSRFMDARLLQLLKIYIEDAGALDNVPLVFEDYCMHYMKFHGKQGSRVRILFSKTGSGFPMILGFGDTLGCCFVNGRGLYVGYPDDVTEKKVVIGHTGPYAMPPLHGRREFRTSSVVNDVAKTADCGWHCNGLWRTFMDAGSARHLWYNEMVEDEQLDKEVDYWRWNTGSPCKNSKCPRYNVRTDYRASVYL
ncbi:hypothetical protein C8J55DRAFT_595260 [Lentinula edodes]|uniref:Uncharacterized protein n=1 Tax=Lentinula lateritia TaxID=40482 RepID=A0A9W9APL2_9AGAR|nr:hypothetical protein C8J55DRAFT_595260 [Lentinula edodes]